MNLNKVFIIGRITTDIALKATSTNQAVTSFNVATNRVWTDKSGQKQEEAEFHTVVVWGRQAELASQFLSKGSMVLIEGRLKTRTWKDTNNQNHKVTEIICERIQFGPKSQNSGFKSSQAPQSYGKPKSEPVMEEDVPQISVDESLEDEIKPEDLPF